MTSPALTRAGRSPSSMRSITDNNSHIVAIASEGVQARARDMDRQVRGCCVPVRRTTRRRSPPRAAAAGSTGFIAASVTRHAPSADLDVVAALAGRDVLALQTMLFVVATGRPDMLIGGWVALDHQHGGRVPLDHSRHPARAGYPEVDEQAGHGGNRLLADISTVAGAHDPDESRNGRTANAAKTAGARVVDGARSGDVVFLDGRVLHRSQANEAPRGRDGRSWPTTARRAPCPRRRPAGCWRRDGDARLILARGSNPPPVRHPTSRTARLPHGRPKFASRGDVVVQGTPA